MRFSPKTIILLLSTLFFVGIGVIGVACHHIPIYKSATFVAGGTDSNTNYPLLVRSISDGNSWSVTELPFIGLFNAIACTGEITNTLCIATGEYGSSDYHGPPWVALNTSRSKKWTTVPYFQNQANIYPNTVSCTGPASHAICVVGGQAVLESGPEPGMLFVSTDSGVTWTQPATSLLPPTGSGIIFGSDCIGSGSNAFCVAVGQDYTDNAIPLLLMGLDGGKTWSRITTPNVQPDSFLYATSCTGEKGHRVCIAAGGVQPGSVQTESLLLVSHNGDDWTQQNVPNISFFNANCQGNGEDAFCVIVGQNIATNAPAIIASHDGGNTWFLSPLPATILAATNNETFNSVSCTNTGFCVAVGGQYIDVPSNPPLIVVSKNAGQTWSIPSIDLPVAGSFYSVSCNSNSTCIVVGMAGVSPILYLTKDAGLKWTIPTIPGLTNLGAFYSAATSN